jgi:hypothetical protein
MAEYPTVDDTTRKFQEEGFELVVNATQDGFLAPAVNMHPRRPGHRTGPVGSGSTPEQAAFHAWEMFADHRDDYLDS